MKRSSKDSRRLSILILPHDAGNVAPLMARRFREMGHQARAIIFAQSYLGYRLDPQDKVIGGRGIKALLLLELKRWWVLYHALNYDVVIFTYGSTIFPNPAFVGMGLSSQITPRLRFYYSLFAYPFAATMLDVRILKHLGKKIGVLFQGGDGRRGDILRQRGYPDIDEEPSGYYSDFIDRLKAHRARIWNRYADVVWMHNPDLWWGLPEKTKFLGYPMEEK